MNNMRKNERINIKLSSSIRSLSENKRNFCIIRNISKKGVYLTAKRQYDFGQPVECIISFGDHRIMFKGIIRRVQEEQEQGYIGYGIEITEIDEKNARILEDFVEAGYLPKLEEEK